ncbi:MAG: siderophore-interacting protein [Pseudomonadota bacterium]
MLIPKSKPKRIPKLAEVRRRWHLTPNMIRVTLGADFIETFEAGIEGAHCKLFLPEADEARGPFERRLTDGPRPIVRTYTIRHIRPEDGELDIDFVDHGDHGPASAWANRAEPGDFVGFGGPGPVKLRDYYADFYLVTADMAALPLAAATLEAMPRDATGLALLEITAPEDRQEIAAPKGVELRWMIHGDPAQASTRVPDIVTALPTFTERVQTCIAGESTVVAALRENILQTRGVPKTDAYISSYWKIGMVEDEHQAFKNASAA